MFSSYIIHQRKLFYAKLKNQLLRKTYVRISKNAVIDKKALEEYEWLADFTLEALETYLKENDEDTIAAGRLVEETMREKLMKSRKIRDLIIENSQIKTEINELSQRIRECKSYMIFLADVAQEILRREEENKFKEIKRARQEKVEMIKLIKSGLSPAEAKKQIDENYKRAEEEFSDPNQELYLYLDQMGPIRERMEKKSFDKVKDDGHVVNNQKLNLKDLNASASCVKILNEPEDGFDEENLIYQLKLVPGNEATDRKELDGLVFSEPHQLLKIFSEIESQNLSLIRHSQATDDFTRGYEVQINDTTKILKTTTRDLRRDINKKEIAINKLLDRIKSVTFIIDMFDGENISVKRQERLLHIFNKYLKKVYRSSTGMNIFMNPILMLTAIEKSFEDLVEEISAMPDEVILGISREMDKEHREAERVEILSEKRRNQMAKIKKSSEKALIKAPIYSGRKIMARSKPQREKLKLSQTAIAAKAKEDEFQYFFGE